MASEGTAPTVTAAPAAAVSTAAPPAKGFTLAVPQGDEVWSAWYKEQADTFEDFATFDPKVAAGNQSQRQLSARQLSGQFEDDVARSWEEDWEDEDPDDSYDRVMGLVGRFEAASSAAARK